MGNEEKRVILTGFGPFGGHETNPSDLVVKRIAQEGISDSIQLVTHHFPVVYEQVSQQNQSLWSKDADLVVHLGVAGCYDHVVLEQSAYNSGYCRKDVQGLVPKQNECVREGEQCLSTKMDVKRIVEELGEDDAFSTMKFGVSSNPGKYLCGFVYYDSLQRDSSKVLFVHIPTLDSLSEDTLTLIVKTIITLALNHLS